MTMYKGTSEMTPCNGAVNYTINQRAQTVTCKFAQLTQGAICTSCPWTKLCAQLFTPESPKKTVRVKAFSGMSLGELEVIKETNTHIEVKTTKGNVLKFDKKTGVQLNATNPKYASRLEAV